MACAFAVHAAGMFESQAPAKPKQGIPPPPPLVAMSAFDVLKSVGFPKKFHCSPLGDGELISLVPLKSVETSLMPQGVALSSVTMELSDHPSRSWAGALIPGIA